MKIRFISDLHSALNMTYSPTEFVDIMKAKMPADITLIAGDMSANIDEAKSFLNTYFKDEKRTQEKNHKRSQQRSYD